MVMTTVANTLLFVFKHGFMHLIQVVYCLTSFIEICMHVYAVGTNVGEIAIWEVSTCERLALKPFKVWDLSLCSIALQVSSLSFLDF